jgi:hypothetical protein
MYAQLRFQVSSFNTLQDGFDRLTDARDAVLNFPGSTGAVDPVNATKMTDRMHSS